MADTTKALNVIVGAKLDGFKGAMADLNKEIGSAEKDWKRSFGNIAAEMKSVGMTLAGLGAAVTVPMALAIKSFAETSDAIEEMSLKSGLSVTAIQELGYAAKLTGSSMEGIGTAVKMMQKALGDAEGGSKTAIKALNDLGLSLEDIINLTPDEQFMAIAGAIAEIEDPTKRTNAALDLFGKSGTELLPMLADGKKGLQAFKDEAHDTGAVLTELQIAAGSKLQDSLDKLKATTKGLSDNLASTLAPVLTDLINNKIAPVISGFTNWSKNNPELSRTIMEVAGTAGVLATAFGGILYVLPNLVSGFNSLKIGASALMGTPFFAVAFPIVAALGAVALTAITVTNALKDAQRQVEEFGGILMQSQNLVEGTATIIYNLDGTIKGYANTMAKTTLITKENDASTSALAKTVTDYTATVNGAIPVEMNMISMLEEMGKKALGVATEAFAKLKEHITAVADAFRFSQTAAADWGVTVDDVIKVLTSMGISEDEISRKMTQFGIDATDANAVMGLFGLSADEVAKSMVGLGLKTDAFSQTAKRALDVAKKAMDDFMKSVAATNKMAFDTWNALNNPALYASGGGGNVGLDQAEAEKANARIKAAINSGASYADLVSDFGLARLNSMAGGNFADAVDQAGGLKQFANKTSIQGGGMAKTAYEIEQERLALLRSNPGTGLGYVNGYASGGIAWQPQIATLAESGPEMIIPMDRLSNLRGGTVININNPVVRNDRDIDAIGNMLVSKLRLMGIRTS